ncbi:MAG: universal stress protein [Acidobacteriia bacterium]|nr:universal stress protein [Terriglobia bacterium]
MPQIGSILCPVDFSEFSVNAYECARSLAWHYKATLILQHVLYPLYSGFARYDGNIDSYEEIARQLRAEGQEKLQQFARLHARREIRPQCIVQDGLVTDLILSLAEAQRVDLIVMGTHGLRGVDRLMLGSVTERVLRRARCPVLAVRKPAHHVASSAHDPEPVHLRKMLLCTDFSDHGHRASEYAVSMAKECGAELTLLHVLEDVSRLTELESATEKVARQLEESIAPKTREGCIVKVMVRIGKAYQQIIQLAVEAQMDLVIMGVRGRGALDTAIFGSTTYRVIQLGSCPVLTVHI